MPSTAVSVIIPIYNRAEYLPDCLASIECQTLPNIEVLCIDDASTDASAAIVEHFAENDPRFKLFSFPENQGAAAARNYGIQQATGEFVAFMDSDDWYPENTTLEKLYNAARSHNATIVGGSMSEYRSKTRETITSFPHDALLQHNFVFPNEGIVDYRTWQGDYGFYRFLFQQQLILKNNIAFPHFKRQEDPIFLVNAMLAAKSFYAIPDIVYCYRTEHKNSRITIEAAQDGIAALAELIDISYKENLPILRQHQFELINWYVFNTSIMREYDSWKSIGALVGMQAKESIRLRMHGFKKD